MFTVSFDLSSPDVRTPQFLLPDFPETSPHKRRLRLYLVGSPADTQREIDRLHLLGYAERFEWSRVIQIPENGLIIRPDSGDVLRYLQWWRSAVPSRRESL